MTEDRCDFICIDAPRAEAIRERLPVEGALLEAAERAKALSDPTRLTLAEALRRGRELCVCDLSWIAGRSQNLVSHHLRTLRSLGMVRSRRDGKLVMYSLTDVGRSLLGVPCSARRESWGRGREPPEEDAAGPGADVPGCGGQGAGSGARRGRWLHGRLLLGCRGRRTIRGYPEHAGSQPRVAGRRHYRRSGEDRRARRGDGLRELRGHRGEARGRSRVSTRRP